jgi:hypothetical protein
LAIHRQPPSKGFHLNASTGKLADENARFRHGVPGEIGKAACSISEYEGRVLVSPSFGVVLRF